jgi:hypothetical protein
LRARQRPPDSRKTAYSRRARRIPGPVDRHRIANPAWFEDYSVDFVHRWNHQCTYISGETTVDLPLGKVYIEISKGFEIRPVRTVLEIWPDTEDDYDRN